MPCTTLPVATTLPTPMQAHPRQAHPPLPSHPCLCFLIPNARSSMNMMDAPSAGSFTLDTDLGTALLGSLQAKVIKHWLSRMRLLPREANQPPLPPHPPPRPSNRLKRSPRLHLLPTMSRMSLPWFYLPLVTIPWTRRKTLTLLNAT